MVIRNVVVLKDPAGRFAGKVELGVGFVIRNGSPRSLNNAKCE